MLVSNSVGNATSLVAMLIVDSPPNIAAQPTNRTIAVGACVTFTVQAVGTAPIGFRWKKGAVALVDGVNVSGSASPNLSLCNAQAGDAGGYSCVVTNSVGTATSTMATLTVNNPPLITGQPTNQSVVVGGTAVFKVVATGTAPLSYQWKKDGVSVVESGSVSGTTTAALTLTKAQAANAGNYFVVVSNSVGSATSDGAALTVLPLVPVITGQPMSLVVVRTNGPAATAIFSVTASGAGTLVYQWRFNGVNLAGRTGPTLTLPDLRRTNGGSYSVLVANANGSVTSSNAVLRVIAPTFVRGPVLLPGGQWRLLFADTEGLPYVAGFRPALELHSTMDPGLPADQWPLLSNGDSFSLKDGILWFDAPDPTEARRFYHVTER